jgi:hypothetical protein
MLPTHSLWLQWAHTRHLTVGRDPGSKIVELNATEDNKRTGVAAHALKLVMDTYDLPANSADLQRAW